MINLSFAHGLKKKNKSSQEVSDCRVFSQHCNSLNDHNSHCRGGFLSFDPSQSHFKLRWPEVLRPEPLMSLCLSPGFRRTVAHVLTAWSPGDLTGRGHHMLYLRGESVEVVFSPPYSLRCSDHAANTFHIPAVAGGAIKDRTGS